VRAYGALEELEDDIKRLEEAQKPKPLTDTVRALRQAVDSALGAAAAAEVALQDAEAERPSPVEIAKRRTAAADRRRDLARAIERFKAVIQLSVDADEK